MLIAQKYIISKQKKKKSNPLCLENISKYFPANSMKRKKKPGLNGCVYEFFVDYNITESHYCPFEVKLDQCVGTCNTLNDLSNRVCFSNTTEDLNIHGFNMMSNRLYVYE